MASKKDQPATSGSIPVDVEKSASCLVQPYPLASDSMSDFPSTTISLRQTVTNTESTLHANGPAESRARAHLSVVGAFLILFCTFGQFNSFGSYQSWYQDHQLQEHSPSTIAWIGSMQLFMLFLSGYPVGRIFDLYGPRYLMLVGTVVHLLGIMLTSVCTRYYQYVLCQGLLLGLGSGMLFYPPLAAVSTHYNQYRATALGASLAGSSIGGVAYPLILRRLFPTIGFAWSVRVTGFISLACCALALLTISRSPSYIKKPSSESAKAICQLKSFKDSRFILLTGGSFFICFGVFVPYIYIVSYAQHRFISPLTSFYALSAMNAGSFAGRILPSYVSDHLGRFNLLIPSAFFSGVLCLAFWMPATQTEPEIIAFAVLYGFFSGAFFSGVNPCVAQVSDIEQVGTRMGMLYTVVSPAALLGGPAAGALIAAQHQSYTGAIALSGAIMLFGVGLVFCAKLKVNSYIFAKV